MSGLSAIKNATLCARKAERSIEDATEAKSASLMEPKTTQRRCVEEAWENCEWVRLARLFVALLAIIRFLFRDNNNNTK